MGCSEFRSVFVALMKSYSPMRGKWAKVDGFLELVDVKRWYFCAGVSEEFVAVVGSLFGVSDQLVLSVCCWGRRGSGICWSHCFVGMGRQGCVMGEMRGNLTWQSGTSRVSGDALCYYRFTSDWLGGKWSKSLIHWYEELLATCYISFTSVYSHVNWSGEIRLHEH